MRRKVASVLMPAAGVLMIAGAYGHGFVGRLHVDAELGRFPLDRDVVTMLYVVWQFVTGCMILSGTAVIWAFLRARRGDGSLLPIAALVSALYLAVGAGGFVYRGGDPFMLVFVVLGAAVAIGTALLGWAEAPAVAPARDR